MLKTVGYVISSLSVVLLGLPAWSGAESKPLLRLCLVLGMAASVIGMVCRWWTYQLEKKKDPARPGQTAAVLTMRLKQTFNP